MRLLVSSFVLLIPLLAQEPAPNGAAKKKMAMPEPSNLQILKGSNREIIPIMRSYTAALGVQCNYCHVQGNFASDDNPKKGVARDMIRMVMDINTKNPVVDAKVTCYTCHRGATEPVNAPEAKPAAPPAQ